MIGRLLAGAASAALVALLAHRVGSLSATGAVAAAGVGTAAVMAGWGWGALLVLFFVTSTALSRAGAEAKAMRTAAVVAKGGARDAVQVLANGGAFALLAVAAGITASQPLAAAAAGALAAATADTWATEVGTLAGGTPRSVRGWRAVPPGTSGAVSLAGTVALVAGAAVIAIAATLLHLTRWPLAVAAGGAAGALADTVLGGMVQQRRWCDACERATERRVHDCGRATRHSGGVAWLDNDAVNAGATVVGALVAGAVVAASRGM